MQPVHSARRSPVTTRRWAIALVIASALALALFIANPSFVVSQTPSHGTQRQVAPTAHRRSYLHMVSKPSDIFAKPVKGTWVYFVAVSPNKRHYLHCTIDGGQPTLVNTPSTGALASIQSLKSTGTTYDITVFFDGDDNLAIEAFKLLGVTNVHRYETYVTALKHVDLTAFHEANKASESGSYYHSYNKLLACTRTGRWFRG